MDTQRLPLFWSFPLGTVAHTRVRVSFLLPLMALWLCFNLGVELGLWASAVLLVTVVLHEFCHVFAARQTGGSADEILLWPAGGLAFCRPAPTFASEFLTPSAGPLCHVVVCLAMLPFLPSGSMGDAISLIYLPAVDLSVDFAGGMALLFFSLNWKLLWLNLLPVLPFDGGQMLASLLTLRFDREQVRHITLRVGLWAALLTAIGGVFVETTFLVFIGFFCFVLCGLDYIQQQLGESYEESFMGYDFSQGYTSLEKAEERRVETRPGPIARWKEQRRLKRELREREERALAEQQLDLLLEKVSREGFDSLTASERRTLEKMSTRFKSRGQSEP